MVCVLDFKREVGLWHSMLASVFNGMHVVFIPYALVRNHKKNNCSVLNFPSLTIPTNICFTLSPDEGEPRILDANGDKTSGYCGRL